MSLIHAVGEVLDRLDAENVPHMLVGGNALEAWGMPRSTLDIDVQVTLERPVPPHASVHFGWIVEERTRDPVFDQDVLILHAPTSGIPIELFVTTHWFTTQAMERRVRLPSRLLDRDVPVPTLEDMLLLKACFRKSPVRKPDKAVQDALDLQGIVGAAEQTDVPYVRENAERLGVWDVLEPIIDKS